MRRDFAVFFLCQFLWLVSIGAAETNTNHVARVTHIEECLKSMENTLTTLEELETQARETNNLAQAECFRGKIGSIKGLVEIGRKLQERLQVLLEDEEDETIEEMLGQIEIACTRSESIVVTSNTCASAVGPVPKPRRRGPKLSDELTLAPRETPPWLEPRPTIPRNADNCLRQGQLADLLVRAMELVASSTNQAATAIATLAEHQIEPIEAWDPEACVTLDDFCVIVSRALALTPADSEDPHAYCQELREYGLPIDSGFPDWPEKADPPYLLETEVRKFLADGLAAPLPSSKPIMPH